MPNQQARCVISDSHTKSGTFTSPPKPQLSCSTCVYKARCLPAGLEGTELLRFERGVQHMHRPLKAGQKLVRQGDVMEAVYALRVGSIKAIITSNDGTEHVLGFRFPGTVIGLAEPEQPIWARTFIALEDAWLCRIPLGILGDSVRSQLVKLMSGMLRSEYHNHVTLAYKSGERKLATFLLIMSGKFQERGLSARRFYLPMSYIDIANFLGMRHESVSRTMASLHSEGIIEKQGKLIQIPDLEALREVVET